MLTVVKEFNWVMSHRLENHEGLCNNVHGHNYKMLVEIQRKLGKKSVKSKIGHSEEGMVVDFNELKGSVNEHIVDYFDHSFCYNKNDDDNKSIAKILKGQIQQKLAPLPYRVTAENIAKYCYEKLDEMFERDIPDVKVVSVTIYENERSFAKYTWR